jgi:hypothetical protein
VSFDGSGPKVIPDLEQTFLADSGYTAPAVGDPVYISSNNAVSKCAGANAAFIGFVQSVPPADALGNQLLNVYVFGHRVRCKNTSGGALSAGAVVVSANGGIGALAATTDSALGATLTANTTSGVITASGLAAIINALTNRRGVVVVGGANNAQVQIIFG